MNTFFFSSEIVMVIIYSVKNIWKSYIWTADKDMNESDPRSDVHYLGSSENKAWKKKNFFFTTA